MPSSTITHKNRERIIWFKIHNWGYSNDYFTSKRLQFMFFRLQLDRLYLCLLLKWRMFGKSVELCMARSEECPQIFYIYFWVNRIYNKISSRSWLVLRPPICHVIGARSRGCLITAVRFQLFVIRHLQLDTHVIFTRITRASLASLAMFNIFQNLGKEQQTFSLERSHKTFFFEICYRYD